MALMRMSASSFAALSPIESAVEQMSAQMLFRHGHRPSAGEKRSWSGSWPVLARDLADAGLANVEVLLEHQLPLASSRVDAIISGTHPKTGQSSYLVVELKQWSSANAFPDSDELVNIDAYGAMPVLHPQAQVAGYCEYLGDFLPGITENNSLLNGVAYLHNATEQGINELRGYPSKQHARLFSGEQRGQFLDYLRSLFDPNVSGADAADALLSGRVGPSKQLLAVAAEEIQQREQFVLLDEQRVAYELVLGAVKAARDGDHKTVVIVSGGPGTGKSVIALSLLGELARQGRSVLHATGSRSFTQTLRKVAGRRSPRTQKLFRYFNQFMEVERNSLDVLILDEAHRIRETSVSRYTKAALRTDRPQIDELISAARVPVFLLDEHQIVRPGESGSIADIKAYAASLGLPVQHVSLDDQFRCGGSEAYVEWVVRLLGLAAGGPITWKSDASFEVAVVESPNEMDAHLAHKRDLGYGARISAGYCWPWSDPRSDGSLVNDVTIGSWSRPWNLKGDRSIGGAPPAALWASDPAGFAQVGCVYTAQGFEYDYSGVIFGPDLVWRTDRWVAIRDANKDPDFRNRKKVMDEEFDALVRNVYKVLLTRGMRGTLLYSTDDETQRFLRSLMG